MLKRPRFEISKHNALLAVAVVAASFVMEKSCGPASPAHAAGVSELSKGPHDTDPIIVCEGNDLVIFQHIGRTLTGSRTVNNSPLCITPTFPPLSQEQLDQQDNERMLQQLQQLAPPPEPVLPTPSPGMMLA